MHKTFLYLLLALVFSTTLAAKKNKYKYELSACTVFQDEAPYLREWIEFHRTVGVQHFFMYNNSSTDNYMEVLEPYIKEGVVELFDWPNRWPNMHYVEGCQPKAFVDAINRCRGVSRWLALLDSDEFCFPVQEYSLPNCLNRHYKNESGVVINWQCYGTSGVYKVGPNELMIEKLTMKGAPDMWRNWFYKSIVKPKDVKTCLNPHLCVYKPGKYHVDTCKNKLQQDAKGIFIDVLRINHYWVRDGHFMHEIKIPRYQKWNWDFAGILTGEAELNYVEDKSILKYVPELKQRMFGRYE